MAEWVLKGNLKGPKGDPGTGVPDGGTPGQLLSKTDSGTAWVDPPSTGNVLTGTATGYVAHADDAYAQKPIEVRVKGRTVKNLWPVLSGTHNGITVSTDGTGLVTVTGTATADADVTADVSGWAAGKSYTAMISAPPTGYSAYFEVQKPSGNTSINATTTGATLNVASDATDCVAGVHVTSGATVNASFRVMLVEGSEAPDCFTPPGLHSVEPGNLVTRGKNFLPRMDRPKTIGGITFTPGEDGNTFTTSGALSDSSRWEILYDNIHLVPGIYTFSQEKSNQSASGLSLLPDYALQSINLINYRIGFIPSNSDIPEGTVYKLQLELGSTATAYEPPNVTATPLPEVELRSLPDGTCDELVIKADGTATVERRTQLSGDEVTALPEPTTEPQSPVTLPALPAPTFNVYHDSDVPSDTTVTYERDINIAFDKLQAQVSATTVREATNG